VTGRAEGRDAGAYADGTSRAARAHPAAQSSESGASRDASVVIVNYESGTTLARCVEGWRTEGPARVVVVDNGSTDGSADLVSEQFPEVEILRPGRNLGYGAAANRGVAATGTPWVIVGNPDLEVHPGALEVLLAALSTDPGCALVGPLIRTPGGDRYPSARRFPSLVDAAGHAALGIVAPGNRFTRTYQQSHLDDEPTGTGTVDWVSGACFAVRRDAFEQVGGFDEAYFMYAEDVDLCWRLGRAGWRVAYAADAEVTHLQGVSTDRHPYRMILEHHRSVLRFAGRSTRGWRRGLVPVMAAAIGLRAVVAMAAQAIGRDAGSRPSGGGGVGVAPDPRL
jgi:N-acetylglucosaminyl-diphospho-decaprenol L-rhamnosyltransferase